jgi:hypothetical protein
MILIVSLFLVSVWAWLMMAYRMGCALSGVDCSSRMGGGVEGERGVVEDGAYE